MNMTKEVNLFWHWMMLNDMSSGAVSLWYSLQVMKMKIGESSSKFNAPNKPLMQLSGLSKTGIWDVRKVVGLTPFLGPIKKIHNWAIVKCKSCGIGRHDSKSCSFWSAGSTPTTGIKSNPTNKIIAYRLNKTGYKTLSCFAFKERLIY